MPKTLSDIPTDRVQICRIQDVFDQICNGCDKVFPVRYTPPGYYDYIAENPPCKCGDGFRPADYSPSIQEWVLARGGTP